MAKKNSNTADDLRMKSADELADRPGKLKKEQFNLRFQRATGQLENTARVRVIRRDIARLKTVAGQKRAGVPEPAAKAEAPAPKKTTRRKAAAKPRAKAKE